MPYTTNLLLPKLVEGQAQKEITVNTALDYLDVMIGGYLGVSVAGGIDVVLTEAQLRSRILKFTGTITANISVVVPDTLRSYVFLNATSGAYTLSAVPESGTGFLLPAGLYVEGYYDGTNLVQRTTPIGPGNLTLKSGTAQAAAADTVSLWEGDVDGVAGKGGLLIMTEDGSPHVFGDNVGINVSTGLAATVHVKGDDGGSGTIMLETNNSSASGSQFSQRHSRGTAASPVVVNAADVLLNIIAQGYARNAADSADAWTSAGRIRVLVQSKDAQGRIGGYIEFSTAAGVSAAVAEVARISEEGNLLLGATTYGTSAVANLVFGMGTAPASAPGNRVHVWGADFEGVNGNGALHIQDESGIVSVIGKGTFFRRSVEANTAGSGAPNVLLSTESFKVLTNEGSSAKNYHTLPTATVGLQFTFVSQDADLMRVKADTGDTIRVAAGVTASAGYIENGAQGDMITLLAINNTEWIDIGSRGTWTPT